MRFLSELPTNSFEQSTAVRLERTQEFWIVIFFVSLNKGQDWLWLDSSQYRPT